MSGIKEGIIPEISLSYLFTGENRHWQNISGGGPQYKSIEHSYFYEKQPLT
jgi:hypothetical protein